MGFHIEKLSDTGGSLVTCTQFLYLTAGRDEVVGEGDERAAFVFCIPGQQIAKSEAERLGLLEGQVTEPESAPAEDVAKTEPTPDEDEESDDFSLDAEEKQAEKPEDKQAPKSANKARRARKSKGDA